MKWEKMGQKLWRKGETWREKFQKIQENEYNLLNMEEVWEICFNASKVGMIGAKYAVQPSGAGYKVPSQNYWRKQSKGEMKWNKSFTIAISPSQKHILAINRMDLA